MLFFTIFRCYWPVVLCARIACFFILVVATTGVGFAAERRPNREPAPAPAKARPRAKSPKVRFRETGGEAGVALRVAQSELTGAVLRLMDASVLAPSSRKADRTRAGRYYADMAAKVEGVHADILPRVAEAKRGNLVALVQELSSWARRRAEAEFPRPIASVATDIAHLESFSSRIEHCCTLPHRKPAFGWRKRGDKGKGDFWIDVPHYFYANVAGYRAPTLSSGDRSFLASAWDVKDMTAQIEISLLDDLSARKADIIALAAAEREIGAATAKPRHSEALEQLTRIDQGLTARWDTDKAHAKAAVRSAILSLQHNHSSAALSQIRMAKAFLEQRLVRAENTLQYNHSARRIPFLEFARARQAWLRGHVEGIKGKVGSMADRSAAHLNVQQLVEVLKETPEPDYQAVHAALVALDLAFKDQSGGELALFPEEDGLDIAAALAKVDERIGEIETLFVLEQDARDRYRRFRRDGMTSEEAKGRAAREVMGWFLTERKLPTMLSGAPIQREPFEWGLRLFMSTMPRRTRVATGMSSDLNPVFPAVYTMTALVDANEIALLRSLLQGRYGIAYALGPQGDQVAPRLLSYVDDLSRRNFQRLLPTPENSAGALSQPDEFIALEKFLAEIFGVDHRFIAFPREFLTHSFEPGHELPLPLEMR